MNVEMTGWQPITTAPKDGTDLLLSDGTRVTVGKWFIQEPSFKEHRDLDGRWIGQDEEDGYECWVSWGDDDITPTHWMPLPEPSTYQA